MLNIRKELMEMRKTSVIECDNKITVDIIGLQGMLSLGKTTSNQIGEEAGAVIRIGKRKLYNVEKVKAYMNRLTEV